MPAAKISLDEAKPQKLFYVVANVVVVRGDGRCLLLKRSESEKVHPGKWCVPGGKLEWKDLDLEHPTKMNGEVYDFEGAVEDLLVRETAEESGLTIEKDDMRYINSVAYVRPDGVPVLMVKLAARYSSGEVVLEEGSFTQARWVTAREARVLPCIRGIPEEVEKAIAIFS